MHRFIYICGLGFIAFYFAYWWWATHGVLCFGSSTDICLDLYQKNARTPIFSGLITMGSFLLALKTTILARLKDTYDTPKHRTNYRVEKEKQKAGNPKLRYYNSLENLSQALGLNVILCFVTSVTQMTLGFVWTAWAFAICCSLATGTLFLLVYLTTLLMSAHKEWFEMIEEKAQIDLDQLDKGNKTELSEKTK